jgi:hypothetical protein
MSDTKEKAELSGVWKEVHGAIWLIGLAILAWRGWWWPGILVLVAISGLAQTLLARYQDQTMAQQTLVQTRTRGLPENCPSCGGPLDAAKIKWSGETTALCPFCGSNIKAIDGIPTAKG